LCKWKVSRTYFTTTSHCSFRSARFIVRPENSNELSKTRLFKTSHQQQYKIDKSGMLNLRKIFVPFLSIFLRVKMNALGNIKLTLYCTLLKENDFFFKKLRDLKKVLNKIHQVCHLWVHLWFCPFSCPPESSTDNEGYRTECPKILKKWQPWINRPYFSHDRENIPFEI